MNFFRHLIALSILILIAQVVFAQKENTINLERLNDNKVAKAIQERSLEKIDELEALQATCKNPDDTSYNYHTKTYYLDKSINDVWNTYNNIQVNEVWNGKIVRFGFIFSRANNEFIYPDQDGNKIDVGQIIFFNVKLLKGATNLVTALEVTNINEEEKSIEFCYIQDGNTQGTQKIILHDKGASKTEVEHFTYFKSVNGSKFRDKRLYPHFHTKSIGEIHENIQAALGIDIEKSKK